MFQNLELCRVCLSASGCRNLHVCFDLQKELVLFLSDTVSVAAVYMTVQTRELNYDRHSMAVALREGDMVLVLVTAFEGRHKIQNQWKNREYVVEWQPYPNLLVYMVCARDGEGCSWTLHSNCLLPISNNLAWARDELIDQLNPVPHADSGLLANRPTESQLESQPGLLTKQYDLADLKLTELTTLYTMSDNSQA